MPGPTRKRLCTTVSAGQAMKCRKLYPSWLLLVVLVVFPLPSMTTVSKHKYFDLMAKCHSYSLHRIEGAVVRVGDPPKVRHHPKSCDISFQTTSVLEKFHLQFRLLELQCGDRLLVYDAGLASKYLPPQANLTCRSGEQDTRTIITQTNFVTLRYLPTVTQDWKSNVTVIITAVRDPKFACDEFRCKTSELCVSETVTCDGVKNCDDGSDESSELCPPSSMVDTGSPGKGPFAYEGKTYYVSSGADIADCRRFSLSLLLSAVTLLPAQGKNYFHYSSQMCIFLLLGVLQQWWMLVSVVSAVVILIAIVFIVKVVCCK